MPFLRPRARQATSPATPMTTGSYRAAAYLAASARASAPAAGDQQRKLHGQPAPAARTLSQVARASSMRAIAS